MANCKDCNIQVNSTTMMVMLKDKIWRQISDDEIDLICSNCMEKRMGRSITHNDFKKSRGQQIPCNMLWLEAKDTDQFNRLLTAPMKKTLATIKQLWEDNDDLM